MAEIEFVELGVGDGFILISFSLIVVGLDDGREIGFGDNGTIVGLRDGSNEGILLVCDGVGLGSAFGYSERDGPADSAMDGSELVVGIEEGATDGTGMMDGWSLGPLLGGVTVGDTLLTFEGRKLGHDDGPNVGAAVGTGVVGPCVGDRVGAKVNERSFSVEGRMQ